MKLSHFSLIMAVIFLLILPSIFFIYNFTNQKISDDTSNWGDFGSYLSAAISLCNLVVFIILTFALQRYNEKESEHTKSLQKPILSFFKRENSMNYSIENVGAGTALNIIVRAQHEIEANNYLYFTRCYSLRSGSISKSEWSNELNVYVAQYDDLFGNRYYSYFEDNYLRFFSEADGKRNDSFEYRRASLPIIKAKIV